jgi:hypothetical protein
MSIGGSFLGFKQQGHETDHLLPSSAEEKKRGAIPPFTHTFSWVMLGDLSEESILPIFLTDKISCCSLLGYDSLHNSMIYSCFGQDRIEILIC